MNTLNILVLLFTISLLRAQNTGNATLEALSRISPDNATTFDNRYQGVKGSPFILEKWNSGIVFTSGQSGLPLKYLNFDRHAREICYRETPEGTTRLLNKYLIDSLKIFTPSDTLSLQRERLPRIADFVFLEKIYQGRSCIYKDYAKRFIEADYEQPYSADRRYDEFKDEAVYYLRLSENGDLMKVTRNKKQVAANFGTESKRMLQYIKSEKPGLNNPADLVSMMMFYDAGMK